MPDVILAASRGLLRIYVYVYGCKAHNDSKFTTTVGPSAVAATCLSNCLTLWKSMKNVDSLYTSVIRNIDVTWPYINCYLTRTDDVCDQHCDYYGKNYCRASIRWRKDTYTGDVKLVRHGTCQSRERATERRKEMQRDGACMSYMDP